MRFKIVNHEDEDRQSLGPKFPTEKIVRYIIIVGWGLFAGIIGYNVFLYTHIDIHWRIAIIAFIFLLPFSFFLQALMSEIAIRVERGARIEKGLQEALRKYSLQGSRTKRSVIDWSSNWYGSNRQ